MLVAPHIRISSCVEKLTRWASETFGCIKKKIKKIEKELTEVQGSRVDTQMLNHCEQLARELDELHRLEESYWFARSRANEMKDGDKNTSYFHRKASQRKRKNCIKGLFDKHDVWHEKKEDLHIIVSDYFTELFTTDAPSEFEEAMVGLSSVVTDEMNGVLDMEPSRDEIKMALFQMHPNKAPGPDGMHALFFQKLWNIVGSDIISFVKRWWNGLVDLSEANKTCIVLIPKCDDPKNMTEFRPISCCNVL